MKRFLILLLMIFSTNSFASGIASNTASAPCTNTTLETYSGNSNLSADWQPNEIQLRWYNNNTLMDVQSSANTCVYDGTLSVPQTAPTRTGYTFAGWQVRPEMDFGELAPGGTKNLTNGLERWGKGENITSHESVCFYYNIEGTAPKTDCASDSHFAELSQHEWQVLYDNNGKTLYGAAHCGKKPGVHDNYGWTSAHINQWQTATVNELDTYNGSDASSEMQYCWCKATGYRENTASPVYGSLYPIGWVYAQNWGSAQSCWIRCADDCSHIGWNNPMARRALFTPIN